jgi:hypothetical protein
MQQHGEIVCPWRGKSRSNSEIVPNAIYGEPNNQEYESFNEFQSKFNASICLEVARVTVNARDVHWL